ncbi:hypothetical protein SALBM311S_08523 [Streptomyces alboniger]
MDSVLSHRSLYWGAHKFAHSAMDAHARHDEEIFLLHAGVSIERLTKAVLSKTSPFLLMELKGNDDTLFQFAGLKELKKVRTAGASQVIGRLRAMDVLPKKDADLDELIELRNGVAHLLTNSSESFDALGTFARVSNTLLPHLDVEPAEFWGTWNDAIGIALSESLAEVAREIGGRIEQAKYRLDKRLDGVPSDAVSIIYKNANDGADAGGFGVRVECGNYSYHSPRECPACRCAGHLVVTLPGIGATPEGDPNRYFHCPLCSFSAYGVDELTAAGIAQSEVFFSSNGEPLTGLDPSFLDEFVTYGMLDRSGVAKAVRVFAEQAAAARTTTS